MPEGFEVSVFARDLGNARMMAVSKDGTVYVTRPNEKDVIALAEGDTKPRVVASDVNEDGTIGKLETLIDDLPDGGQHGPRTLAFAPGGALHCRQFMRCLL